MASSRATIRQEAAKAWGRSVVVSTATTGSTSSLVDNYRLLDSNESPNQYEGCWVMPYSGTVANVGRISRVGSYSPTSGTLSLSPSYPSAIANGDGYELHNLLSPDDWNFAINWGLRKCVANRVYSITPVAEQLQYTLPSWVEREDDVTDLWVETGASQRKRREKVPPYVWKVQEEADTLALWLDHAYAPDVVNNLALIVEGIGHYDDLSTDSATTTCPLDWAVWATISEAAQLFAEEIAASQHTAAQRDVAKAIERFQELSRAYRPTYARSVSLR
ncbi:MAG: hypothetical protein U0821_18630 [Chloroflexota bacterium]